MATKIYLGNPPENIKKWIKKTNIETNIITFGDSVTNGSGAITVKIGDNKNYFNGRFDKDQEVRANYPYWLSKMITDRYPNDYNVINQSRGSTYSCHVAAWFGAQEVIVKSDFTLPKTGSVTLNKQFVFKNCTYNNELGPDVNAEKIAGFTTPIYPLVENYTDNVTSDSITGMLGNYRVRIQGEKTSNVSVTSLDKLESDVVIKTNTLFIPDFVTQERFKNSIMVVCMGGNDWIRCRNENYNDEYGDIDPYSYTYKKHIQPLALKLKNIGKRFIIVSPMFNPSGNSQFGDITLTEPTPTEQLYMNDFGENYLNLRLAFAQNITKISKELGIEINGEWYKPGGTFRSTDGVHLTTDGYKVKAAFIKEKLIEIGYLK